MGNHVTRTSRHRRDRDDRWLRRVIVVGALAVAAGMTADVSGATGPTTNVTFTPVTNYKVLSNAYIGANLTRNVVVIGGATPVPTNATTVRLTVTAKGSKAGTLSFYPTGNPAGSNGQTLSWAAGATVTGAITADIGENESLTFKNTSAASATVTATLTGFSTEVAAGDISGSGGTAGQVLTNNGAGGATWKTLTAGDITGLPNRAFRGTGSGGFTGAFVSVASVSVPAGAYALHFAGEFENQTGTAHTAQCTLLSPLGALVARTRGSAIGGVFSASIALTGLSNSATGGAYTVQCRSLQNLQGALFDGSLVAVQVGSAGGVVSSKPVARSH